MSGENNAPSEELTHDINIFEHNTKIDETDEKTIDRFTFIGKLRVRGFFSLYFVISVMVFLFSAIVYIISRISPTFAEFWTRYPAYWLKMLLAKTTTFFSFSFAEFLFFSLPVLIIFYLIYSWKTINKATKPYDFYRCLLPLVCVVLIILSLFFTAFGPAYFRYPLEKNLSLVKKDVSAKELYDTAVKLTQEMEEVIDHIEFRYNGESICPHSYKELSAKTNEAFKAYTNKNDYISSFYSYPKPIVFSELFTYTHVSGVYTFITGEANINVNYPDFILPYTMAHEMSHQRGIAREDEANFVAFLVCMESNDHYIRYSGYSNMLRYVLQSLSSADKALYIEYYENNYPIKLQNEFNQFSVFFEKYRNSTVSSVTGKINDTFLNSQGQKEGIKSYGLVVDLLVTYYKKR